MPLNDIFKKATRAIRAGSAMSHAGTEDGKPLRKKFIINIKQRVLAGEKADVDAAVELLEGKLQEIGGLTPLIELVELDKPVRADGFPDVEVEEV